MGFSNIKAICIGSNWRREAGCLNYVSLNFNMFWFHILPSSDSAMKMQIITCWKEVVNSR